MQTAVWCWLSTVLFPGRRRNTLLILPGRKEKILSNYWLFCIHIAFWKSGKQVFVSLYASLNIFPCTSSQTPTWLLLFFNLWCCRSPVAAGYGKVHFLTVLGPSWLEKLCLRAWPGLWNHLDELSGIVVLCAWCGQNGNRIQDGICAKQVESCRWGAGRMDPCTGYFIWCMAKSQAFLMHY